MSKESDDDDMASESDLESRNVYLVGDVEEALIKSVVKRIINLAEVDADKPIRLIINTYGGVVDDALALYDVMKFSPAPIHTLGLGKIMSAGCLILAAGEHGERRMGRNARFMYHAGYETHEGDIFSHEIALAELKRTERQYDALFAKECGKTIKQVEALYLPQRKNNYMDAAATKKFGVVDKLV